MRQLIKNLALLVALCMTTVAAGYAQEPSKVEVKINEIVKRYENVKGVESVTVVKGSGLELVKMLFTRQFGKDFMKGVKSITMIDYSDATAEVCQALRKEIDAFSAVMKEFNLGEEKKFAEYNYIKSFASSVEENTMSDFITALEDNKKKTKMIMYMAGTIKIE